MGLDLHVRQILEKELDIISGRKVVCLCCFHNAVDHCAGFCAGRRVAEQPVLSADCKGVDLVLCTIVGDFVARILQIVFHIRALSLSVLHCLFQATGQWLCAELIQPTPKSPKHRLFDRKALFLPLFRRKPLYFFFSCKELVTKVPPDLCRYRRITFRRHSLHELSSQIRNDVCGLEVAIKNIINASYSRDLSAKIAAADHVMQKKGMYLGGYRPFGFLPDPSDCHKLILDPVASRYVRLIFELALQGNRTGTIAKILNEKQIPTPAAYHVAESHVYSEQKAWDLQRSHWTSGTVYHVLKNEKYKGTYVGAKFIMPVPCKHRVLRAPLEQQVRIEDSHVAIVTPEEFEQAQMVIMLQHGKHQAGNYTKHQYPLKGKVYCGYCQKLMKYRVLKKLGPSFNCRFSATAVDSPCKRIPISEELLEHIVRNALAAQIKQAEYVLEILHERERKALICFSALERQEEKLSAEKAEIVKQRVALYEQYADGNMSKEEFIRQRDAYRVQEDEKMEQIQRLRAEKNQTFQPVKKDTDNLQAVMNTVGEAGDVMHLSQNVVETFIDRIEVFNDKRVKIHFTFEDVLAGYAE